MTVWRRLMGGRPIVTRLVVAVALTMIFVLLVSSAFVIKRVQFALDRQLDEDLAAYQEIVEGDVAAGTPVSRDTPGQSYQVYRSGGQFLDGDARHRLLGPGQVARVWAHPKVALRKDVGSFFAPSQHPYRLLAFRAKSPSGDVVVATAINRHKHDEALRELALQLAIADLVTLLAASLVGYRTARAALDPVERYRLAAEEASESADVQLPVEETRDDELTRLGHTFNDLLSRLHAASERERQFLSDASHELRAPLAVMAAEVEWARLRPRGRQESDKSLASLANQVERLIGLSDALLELEEVRSAPVPPAEVVELSALLDEIAELYQPQAVGCDRKIEVGCDPELTVHGRYRWLLLAMSNLVSNALRYGAGTIRLEGLHEPASSPEVVLRVSDEGPGFSTEFVERAFDRFTRAEESRTTPGTGLGLALVRAVAEAHGGSARISGATVTLTVPVADEESA
ncbi:MAG: two-component system, OmpR family, sensor kinase [Nocardioidaceae bacterium]|nr:two-component system, OmpR family, sensor kinase [Nocardioidaceae bacterium]